MSEENQNKDINLDNIGLTFEKIANDSKLFLKTTTQEEKIRIAESLINLLELLKDDVISDIDEDFSLISFIGNEIAIINNILNSQIDNIIHDEKFMDLEGKWKGLSHLVTNTETNSSLKIRVLNVSHIELARDLQRAIEFDQSKLFKMIYESEYGTYGGYPFSVMIYDHYFGSNNHEIDVLTKLSSIMAAAHCPLISSVYPNIFNIENFRDINKARDISKIFQVADKIAWNAFRQIPDSKYTVLTLPRVMARAPYSNENNPCYGIDYNEKVNYKNDECFAWINAAYVLGVRISTAFSLYGWTASIRGVEGGGLCEDLPIYIYAKEEGDLSIKCPTEVSITDRREKELSDLGFVSLCHCKGTNKAAFFSVQTCHIPELYDNPSVNANSRMSVSLPYLLTASRFVHYIIVMLRNKIGTFQSTEDIQRYLQRWLANYVLLSPVGSQELKASMPLKEASVVVTSNPGLVGSYSAIVRIMPHFQFEDINVSMRLVSRLPEA